MTKNTNDHRLFFTQYLHGSGLEIGALNSPLPLPKNAQAIYSDILTPEQLDRFYPGSKHPDIISNSEEFPETPTNTFDFIVANHVLEHVTDPLQALGEWYRILKDDGILFLTLPDKRYTFDQYRQRTSLAHLIEDHQSSAPAQQRNLQHLYEWATFVEKLPEKSAQWRDFVDAHIRKGYSIHNHVWTIDDILDIFKYMKDHESVTYSIVDYKNTPFRAIEFLLILKACKRSCTAEELDKGKKLVRKIKAIAACKACIRSIIKPAQKTYRLFKRMAGFVQNRFCVGAGGAE